MKIISRHISLRSLEGMRIRENFRELAWTLMRTGNTVFLVRGPEIRTMSREAGGLVV